MTAHVTFFLCYRPLSSSPALACDPLPSVRPAHGCLGTCGCPRLPRRQGPPRCYRRLRPCCEECGHVCSKPNCLVCGARGWEEGKKRAVVVGCGVPRALLQPCITNLFNPPPYPSSPAPDNTLEEGGLTLLVSHGTDTAPAHAAAATAEGSAQQAPRGNPIKYGGDPLQDFTLTAFLDRFMSGAPSKPPPRPSLPTLLACIAGKRSGPTSPSRSS